MTDWPAIIRWSVVLVLALLFSVVILLWTVAWITAYLVGADSSKAKATVTAYCDGTICADGTRPIAGHTIAAPRSVPFGTKVYIDGVGYRCVHDRTAKKYDGRWDIYFASRAEAILFGKQQLTVEIIK